MRRKFVCGGRSTELEVERPGSSLPDAATVLGCNFNQVTIPLSRFFFSLRGGGVRLICKFLSSSKVSSQLG